jgi:predicted nucleotidyltransferase
MSDIDVLVEFEPGHTPGFAFISIQDELGELLGHPADLSMPAGLSRYIRDKVMRSAQVIYERTR